MSSCPTKEQPKLKDAIIKIEKHIEGNGQGGGRKHKKTQKGGVVVRTRFLNFLTNLNTSVDRCDPDQDNTNTKIDESQLVTMNTMVDDAFDKTTIIPTPYITSFVDIIDPLLVHLTSAEILNLRTISKAVNSTVEANGAIIPTLEYDNLEKYIMKIVFIEFLKKLCTLDTTLNTIDESIGVLILSVSRAKTNWQMRLVGSKSDYDKYIEITIGLNTYFIDIDKILNSNIPCEQIFTDIYELKFQIIPFNNKLDSRSIRSNILNYFVTKKILNTIKEQKLTNISLIPIILGSSFKTWKDVIERAKVTPNIFPSFKLTEQTTEQTTEAMREEIEQPMSFFYVGARDGTYLNINQMNYLKTELEKTELEKTELERTELERTELDQLKKDIGYYILLGIREITSKIKTGDKENNVNIYIDHFIKGLQENKRGGSKTLTKSIERHVYKGRTCVIYMGKRGGKYIKIAGKYVSLRKL